MTEDDEENKPIPLDQILSGGSQPKAKRPVAFGFPTGVGKVLRFGQVEYHNPEKSTEDIPDGGTIGARIK